MKSTGIVRKVDELGRVVLPIELRRALGVEIKDPVEIFVDGPKIILKKYVPYNSCAVTGEISPENKEYANGLVLSPEGVRILAKEIEWKFNMNSSHLKQSLF